MKLDEQGLREWGRWIGQTLKPPAILGLVGSEMCIRDRPEHGHFKTVVREMFLVLHNDSHRSTLLIKGLTVYRKNN